MNNYRRLGNDIVLVVPLWNEEARGSFVYLHELSDLQDIDFVFVNDGSTDNTKAELQLMSRKKNVQVVNLFANVGKAEAIRKGLELGVTNDRYKVIGFLDGDGAFKVNEVLRCAEIAKSKIAENKFDVFCTSRVALSGRQIKRKPSRHLIGRIIRSIIDIKHKNLPYDTQSGFKMFLQDENIRTVVASAFKTRWFVDLELFIALRKKKPGLRIWEEPLDSWDDISNSSITWRTGVLVVLELIYLLRLDSE